MNVCDPISDLLARIRNGQKAGHDVVAVPASAMKIAITHLLKEEGFVRNYKCIRDRKQGVLKIALNYREDGSGVILGVKRESRPGRRRYVGVDAIPFIKNGLGTAIISTSRGLMTCREARKQRLGGELLCSIY